MFSILTVIYITVNFVKCIHLQLPVSTENNPRTETSVYSIDVIGYFPSWNPTTSPSEVSLSGNGACRLNKAKHT